MKSRNARETHDTISIHRGTDLCSTSSTGIPVSEQFLAVRTNTAVLVPVYTSVQVDIQYKYTERKDLYLHY